jgi:hypothetical protein
MISIDFFGCKKEQVVTCSFEEACDRFPFTSIIIPGASALTWLSEALTGTAVFSADPIPSSREPFSELSDYLQAAIRDAFGRRTEGCRRAVGAVAALEASRH